MDRIVSGKYGSTGPDSPIGLFTGDIRVAWSGTDAVGLGRVTYGWYPGPGVDVEVELDVDFQVPDMSDHFTIELVGQSSPVKANLRSASQGFPYGSRVRSRVQARLVEELVIGNPAPTSSVIFHVPNLPIYTGEWVETGTPPGHGMSRARLSAAADTWRVDLDGVKDLRSLLRPLNGTGGYLVTHVGRITRLDGKPIAYEAVDRLMQETCWWLSLLRGERTGPVLVVGVNDGHEVWERWDRATVSPWHGRWSWLPEFVHDGEVFSPVTDGGLLHQLDVHWPDGTWRDATSRVIDWYNQALSSSSLSRIIMAQAGIELMSWYSLVAPGSLSEDGFDKLAAADSLRLALRFAQVDPAVPVSLGALDAAAAGPKGRKALDGPAAITEVRNGLVHPKASGRFADPGAQYEASVLAIRYLELLVLRSLNFDGSMWDRTRGVTGKPPWL